MKHGTNGGYIAGCREACCRKPHAAYHAQRRKRLYLGRTERLTTDSTVTQRQIQALQCIGWRQSDIGEMAGFNRGWVDQIMREERVYLRTAKVIAKVYAELHMKPGPSEIARARAKRHGWMPPLAWDDIENDEVPAVRMPGMCGKNRHPESQMRERTHDDGATRKYCPACKSEWAVEKKRAKEMAQ